MTYEEMYKTALDSVNKLVKEKGEVGEQVCIIRCASGKTFSGVSSNDGTTTAAVDAARNMQKSGELIADTIIVLKTSDRQPVLPDKKSVDHIMAIDPKNAECTAVMPGKTVKLSELSGSTGQPAKPSGTATTGNLLKDRVNSIMSIVDDDDDDDAELLEEISSKKKKKFFGLF